MKNRMHAAALYIVLSFTLIANSSALFAQSSVRDEFPTGAQRGLLFEHFSKDQWESSTFAKTEVMKKWQDLRYGMFIHFGITSRAMKDLSWGSISQRYAPDSPAIMANGQKRMEEWTNWPNDMKLEKFDANEWVAIAQRAGFKYIVVTTKHHEGFHMWDTAFSDFKITKTPFGRDYIKEVVDACHAAEMPVGFYFAQREWYHPDYQPVDLNNPGKPGPRHAKYLEYMNHAIRELCTKYGKIDIWWWDAVTWGCMFNKEMWDSEKMSRIIRKLQPGIAINNRASIPGDFDTPEGHLGAFQDWRPWESCIPLCDGWSYTGAPAHSFDHILHLVVGAACGNGNLLLSWGPKWDGAFDDAQKQRLFEIGDWLQANGASIYGTRGGPWKPAGWGGSTHNGKTAYIHLFNHPGGDLVLPAIAGRSVVSAKLLVGGERVNFKQSPQRISITIPSQAVVNGDLVIALTMNDTLDGLTSVCADDVGCAFAADPSTYGSVVSRHAKIKASSTSQWMAEDGGATLVAESQPQPFAFHTGEEVAPFVEIDLGREMKVTGLYIRNAESTPERMATMRASVSPDGSTWFEIWKAQKADRVWEVPVTEFVSGAQIPGRQVRFIRLQTHPAKPDHLLLKQVEVWGK